MQETLGRHYPVDRLWTLKSNVIKRSIHLLSFNINVYETQSGIVIKLATGSLNNNPYTCFISVY